MGLLDEPPPPASRGSLLRSALVVLVLGALGAGGYWLLHRRPQSKPTPAVSARPSAPAATTLAAVPPASVKPETRPTVAPPPPAATTASLHVDADVAGAQVFLDRRFVGTTPADVRGLEPGPHRLNVSAEGYEMQVVDLDLAPGPRELRVSFKEVRLDAMADVVHKHGMGSCQGRLSATVEGIRYAASKREDAFQAPLAAIERLDVDYLKKSLRLELKGGKRYSFGEQASNPDNLLRFAQAVDKARKALK